MDRDLLAFLKERRGKNVGLKRLVVESCRVHTIEEEFGELVEEVKWINPEEMGSDYEGSDEVDPDEMYSDETDSDELYTYR